ncbi:MAG: hypothetical protein AAF483_25010, partial [Planctomycetota bacterium]
MSGANMGPPNYLVTPCLELWHLADAGEVFVFTSETRTVCFTKQLADVFQAYSTTQSSLPPLTTVLIVLSALQSATSEEMLRGEVQMLYDASNPPNGKDAIGTPSEVWDWLFSLRAASEELGSGHIAQANLIAALFSKLPTTLFEAELQEIIDSIGWLRVHPNERYSLSWEQDDPNRCMLAWKSLLYLARTFATRESLELQIRTGLTQVPSLEDSIPIEAPESIAQLIEQIEEDEEVGSVARMSRLASSLLTIPRQPSEPDALPSGGVSDITNRGHPERLLTTELAAEPMLLLARIATGQALYMRREQPPISTRSVRPVLIENSIRTWGSTRVRCLAAALAVALVEERFGECEPRFW